MRKLLSIPHGTQSGYNYHKCRCPECKDAKRAYCAPKGNQHKKITPETWNEYPHGTYATYTNQGCRCIACKTARKEYQDLKRYPEKRRLAKFGLTIEDYEKLLQQQNGVCKICKGLPTASKRFLSVDHCHVTGKVRGLLCDRCNIGVGYFRDNPELLMAAAEYLVGEDNDRF